MTTTSLPDTNNMMKEVVVDIGINLTNKAFKSHWREVVQRAIDSGVTRMLLTGTCIKTSKESLQIAQDWLDETKTPNLYATVGIHPHDAKTFDDTTSTKEMREMLQHPLAVAVGECGLDYNRNFSTPDDQHMHFVSRLSLQ